MDTETKEKLRQMRKEAYQKAKALRDADPEYQELKEKEKQKRKELYRHEKELMKQRQKEQQNRQDALAKEKLRNMIKRGSEL